MSDPSPELTVAAYSPFIGGTPVSAPMASPFGTHMIALMNPASRSAPRGRNELRESPRLPGCRPSAFTSRRDPLAVE